MQVTGCRLQENSRAANSPGLSEAGYSKSRLRVLASVASLALNSFSWRSWRLGEESFPRCGKLFSTVWNFCRRFFHSVEKMAQSCSIVWKSGVKVVPLCGKSTSRAGKQETQENRKRTILAKTRARRAAREARAGVRVQSSGEQPTAPASTRPATVNLACGF